MGFSVIVAKHKLNKAEAYIGVVRVPLLNFHFPAAPPQGLPATSTSQEEPIFGPKLFEITRGDYVGHAESVEAKTF